MTIDHTKPRNATPKPAIPERVVYTDASGKSAIIDAATLDPARFASSVTIDGAWSLKTGFRRKSTFVKTNFIYGLELLALLALLHQDNNDIRDKSATFYFDNNNALQALVRNTSGHTVTQWGGCPDLASNSRPSHRPYA